MLSGGEQALTALSLIFAVFLTNPSPICVLDEVDAPLDDYNVERFCDLLEEMRKRADTRFVTITHNPITMARMDRLFGVTMAERGVSQIVLVERGSGEAAGGGVGSWRRRAGKPSPLSRRDRKAGARPTLQAATKAATKSKSFGTKSKPSRNEIQAGWNKIQIFRNKIQIDFFP